MESDKPFVRKAGIAGLILAIVWGVALIYWYGFVDREDLYGTSRAISTIFGYVMMLATSGGMLFVFDMIGWMEKRIRSLEDIVLLKKPDAIDLMCDDFGSPRF